MKNKYFNEREKRLFDHFSKKNDFPRKSGQQDGNAKKHKPKYFP